MVFPTDVWNIALLSREILFQERESNVETSRSTDALNRMHSVFLNARAVFPKHQYLREVAERRIPILGEILCSEVLQKEISFKKGSMAFYFIIQSMFNK